MLLGYERDVNPIDTVVEPRGYRVLSRIPGLSQVLVERLVQHFGSISHVIAANPRELAVVSGLGPVRSREVYDSLRRMQEYFALPQQSQGRQ